MIAILLKDLRRLGWVAILNALLLARLSQLDIQRDQSMVSGEEGWLHVLLPICWAVMMAMAIQEDAPGSRNAFWRTLPIQWWHLLGSKLLFAILTVHLPLLIANVVVLSQRGFSFAHLPWHQLQVIAWLTLPSLGLAVLVRNVSQLLLCAILLLALFAMAMSSGLGRPSVDEIWRQSGLVLAATCGASLFVLRYRARVGLEWIPGVLIALAGVGGSILLLAEVPHGSGALVESRLRPLSEQVKIQLQDDATAFPRPWDSGRVELRIPLSISGVDANLETQIYYAALELSDPAGSHLSMSFPRDRGSYATLPLFAWYLQQHGQGWQVLSFSKAAWNDWKTKRVSIQIDALLSTARWSTITRMSAQQSLHIEGVGPCTSNVVQVSQAGPSLRLGCESGKPLPALIRIDLGENESHSLGEASRIVSYPTFAWLSPIYRGNAYIHLKPGIDPKDLQTNWRVATPLPRTHISYRLDDIELSRYLVEPLRAAK